MRAVVLDDFGSVSVHDRPVPRPLSGEVLIRVVAAGICGSDVHGYTGQNGRRHPGQVMGHEFSGTVAGFGPGTAMDRLSQGQAVTVNPLVLPPPSRVTYAGREQHAPDKIVIGVHPQRDAAFADYVVVPELNVVPLPQGVPIEHGALAEPLAVASHAVHRSGAREGDRVLVSGGGPIGQSILVALRWIGVSEIVVTEIVPGRRDLVESLGAVTVDPLRTSVPDAVMEIFGGAADVAIDAVGTSDTLADALAATREGASICLVGMSAPSVEMDAFRISTGERSIIGSFTYSTDEFREAVGSLADPALDLSTLISGMVTPEQAQAAFQSLTHASPAAGKLLIRFD